MMLIESFPYSNEVWTDEALALASDASGEAGFVVGSGNVPNLGPLIDGLGEVCFMDIEPIHSEIFNAKARAAGVSSQHERDEFLIRANYSLFASNLEAIQFDLTRTEEEQLHWMKNPETASRFVDWAEASSVTPLDLEVDLFAKRLGKNIFPNLGSVAWVHLSNVFPYCDSPRRGSKPKHTHLPRLLEVIPGLKDDTLVTFSKRMEARSGDQARPIGRRLMVIGRPASEITFEDLF